MTAKIIPFYNETLPDKITVTVLMNEREIPWYKWEEGQKNYFEVAQSFRVVVSDTDSFVIPGTLDLDGKEKEGGAPGFKTDFASIPRLLRGVFPVNDSHILAAIVHDYLYRTPDQEWRGKKFADDLFLRIMQETNVPGRKSRPIYWGVKFGGKSSYQRPSRRIRKKKVAGLKKAA